MFLLVLETPLIVSISGLPEIFIVIEVLISVASAGSKMAERRHIFLFNP